MLPLELPEKINLNTKGNPLDHQKDWKEISRISHPSDEKHEYSFDYVIYMKNE